MDISSLIPFDTILSFFVTTTLSFVNAILHPSSANAGMESSGVSISLKWKAVFALSDTSGISNFVVATEFMVCLLAQITLISSWVFFLSSSLGKKCPAAAESATALMCSSSSTIAASALLVLLEEQRCEIGLIGCLHLFNSI